MEKEYDIVLIGAGHNALVCAAYLAKAGKKVIVLERLPYIGGGVVTVDGEGVEVPGVDHIVGKTLPGFKHNLHSTFHEWIFQGPVYWELELEKYGSKYIWQDRTCAMVFSDGSSIIHWQDLDRMVKEIEYFSPKDAKEYRNFINEWMDTARFLVAMWFNPPLPDSTIYAQLEGTPLGKELARNLKCSIRQLVTERFESVHLRTLMCYEASQAGVPDDDLGSG
ncbi:MAG: NAD(P)-binding protein, partial [Thermodesulfobacteriota bacterium]|nr:NAD(P)-binding protein [Thermodesulfobacteriota bacterium]